VSRTIFLIPIEKNVFLTNISLGFIYLAKKNKSRVVFFKPINYCKSYTKKSININTSKIISQYNLSSIIKSERIQDLYTLYNQSKYSNILDTIVSKYYQFKKIYDLVIIEGIASNCSNDITNRLNIDIAKSTNAEIIFVGNIRNELDYKFINKITFIFNQFVENSEINITTGLILNELHLSKSLNNENYLCSVYRNFNHLKKPVFQNKIIDRLSKLKFVSVLSCIPWNLKFISIPISEIVNYLKTEIIFQGKIFENSIKCYDILDQKIENIIKKNNTNYLLIMSLSNLDSLKNLSKVLTKENKLKLIILTREELSLKNINLQIFKKINSLKITLIIVKISTLQLVLKLQNLSNLSLDTNIDNITILQKYVSHYMNNQYDNKSYVFKKNNLFNTPYSFKYHLKSLASSLNKRIILPESSEVRILKAASICGKLGIAKCVLLGNPKTIKILALKLGICIKKNIEIINPDLIRNNYISYLVKKRAAKGMDEAEAKKSLQDNIVLATVMLDLGEVDGLVSGAISTTANTIRPALQLIKSKFNYSLISSAFFMLLPNRVLVYADCAINISPTYKQLAEIAIQSSETAVSFGIDPKIAMISYATGSSSTGFSVEKVKKATIMVKNKRSDLIIDGPIQYDAAVSKDVGRLKAPDSSLHGDATVFIFPDLNTGNTSYKAVQRSSNITSIGPILQGLKKPVNDLSRGSSVSDIIYTIALTVIQSRSIKE